MQRSLELGINQIIEKIERDKLEELISRIKNLDMLLKLGKTDQLLQYVLHVKESVDYAKNRLAEGKNYWLMPYITGLSLVTATFSYIGNEIPEETENLNQFIAKTKVYILDTVTKELVTTGKPIRWELVEDVLTDKEHSVEMFVETLCSEENTQEDLGELVLSQQTDNEIEFLRDIKYLINTDDQQLSSNNLTFEDEITILMFLAKDEQGDKFGYLAISDISRGLNMNSKKVNYI